MSIKSRLLSSILVSASLVSGCVSVLPDADPAAARYAIPASDPADFPSLEPVSFSMTIEDPIATRAIDVTRIALIEKDATYTYYSEGEWADRAPLLVHTALIRSFQNSGSIISVGGRTSQPIADYLLQLDIRSFEADLRTSEDKAHVAIFVRIANTRGKVFGAKLFEVRKVMSTDSPGGAATALTDAFLELSPQIVEWSLNIAAGAEEAA